MKIRKIIISALVSILLGSAIILIEDDAVFGSLTDISGLVKNSSPILIQKRIIFPSTCTLSLNGWSKGSQDFAADEYLKIRSIDIRLANKNESKIIQVKNEHMNILDFEIESTGLLEIYINAYDPSPRDLDIFDAELSCDSYAQKIILVVAFTCIVLGLLTFFALLIYIVFRKLFK